VAPGVGHKHAPPRADADPGRQQHLPGAEDPVGLSGREEDAHARRRCRAAAAAAAAVADKDTLAALLALAVE